EWMSHRDLWARQRQRPWLRRYAAVPLAVQVLAKEQPDLATAEGLRLLRVSGFGGRLLYHGHGMPSSEVTTLLMAIGERYFLVDPVGRRSQRCARDLALLFEAIQHMWRDLTSLEDWLGETRRLGTKQATAVVEYAVEKLQAMGMLR